MNAATGIGVGLAAAVPAGLVIAHERLFLDEQAPDRRAANTRLVAQQFAGVGVAATGAVSWMARGSSPATRIAAAAGGLALSAAPMLAGEWAVRTSPPAAGDVLPPGSDPVDGFLDTLPALPVRAGEIALVGAAVGAGIGAAAPGGWGAAAKGLGLGALAGAVVGAATFAVLGPEA